MAAEAPGERERQRKREEEEPAAREEDLCGERRGARRGGRARLGVDVTVIRTPLSMCCMDTWYM